MPLVFLEPPVDFLERTSWTSCNGFKWCVLKYISVLEFPCFFLSARQCLSPTCKLKLSFFFLLLSISIAKLPPILRFEISKKKENSLFSFSFCHKPPELPSPPLSWITKNIKITKNYEKQCKTSNEKGKKAKSQSLQLMNS